MRTAITDPDSTTRPATTYGRAVPATPHRPGRRSPRPTAASTALTWIAVGMVPLVTVVELAGPRPLSLVLRGVWLAVVAAIVVLVMAGRRRSSRVRRVESPG